MQKEKKFNFYFIVRLRVVGDANPYKVGACLKQKEGKFNLPLNVCLCNGRRNASPTGLYLLREEQAPPLPLRSKNFTHEVNFTFATANISL